MAITEKSASEIWAIGGGKGGTGKSFIISSIGNHLATRGKQVALIDADLGGANLHTFLGIDKPKVTLTDFFERNVVLSDLVVDTGIANLGFIPGAIRTLAPDNLKHTQKLKFFRHVKNLESQYVLIDLGAGTHFNTIDTFLLAHKMIITLVPQITAIENAYYFLKNVFFRKLMNALNDHGLKDLFTQTWMNKEAYGISNLRQLIEYLKSLSSPIERIIEKELSTFTIYVTLNQIRSSQEIQIGNAVKSVCRKYFGFHARYVGYVEHDDIVSRSVNKREAYMQTYPSSRCAKEVERITENLLTGKQIRTRI